MNNNCKLYLLTSSLETLQIVQIYEHWVHILADHVLKWFWRSLEESSDYNNS
jgi:hypothetical protein